MEPVTHFLSGACLGRAGFNRTTGLATLTLTLASEAPDVDIISSFWGPAVGFAHHRGFTHTFLGAPVMAALITAFVWLLYTMWWSRNGRRTKVPIRWGVLYALALLGSLVHILLDFTNNYGVRPFAPFIPRWYSWDIVFIVEPVLLAVLTAALIFPSIGALVQTEIGGKKPVFRGQLAAVLALLAMVTYWFVRDAQHRHAMAILESRQMQTGETLRVGAMPYPVNPFRWFGVVETPNAMETYDVRPSQLQITSYGREGTYYKQPETPLDLAAKSSYLGRVYLDWARFPITRTSPSDDDNETTVWFRDIRYAYSVIPSRSESDDDPKNILGAHVVLDQQGRVIEQWMDDRRQK
jgi:inner membrane protein